MRKSCKISLLLDQYNSMIRYKVNGKPNAKQNVNMTDKVMSPNKIARYY